MPQALNRLISPSLRRDGGDQLAVLVDDPHNGGTEVDRDGLAGVRGADLDDLIAKSDDPGGGRDPPFNRTQADRWIPAFAGTQVSNSRNYRFTIRASTTGRPSPAGWTMTGFRSISSIASA